MKIRVLDVVAVAVTIAFVVWFGASWYEIASSNAMPGSVCSAWNFFEVMF